MGQYKSAHIQAAPLIKMYINPTVTISEVKNRQSLSPSKRSKKHQEDIIRTLAEERDSYFSKLKDIEDELRLIEEQTKNSSLFFGMTSKTFCERLNKILTKETCKCHQECDNQCHQVVNVSYKNVRVTNKPNFCICKTSSKLVIF